jgi:hypothetical protein
LVELCRKSCEAPKLLSPADLEPVRSLVGDGALEYMFVVGGFHFINRIADLLDVDPEALPAGLRRFEFLRRVGVRVASLLFRNWDLQPRSYEKTYAQALADMGPVFARATGRTLTDDFDPLRSRPQLIEALRLTLEERDERSGLSRETLVSVQRVVEDALPAGPEDVRGLHRRPDDPVEAFAFVGTRYAYRATREMIAALRGLGYGDLDILDLAIAIADANQWARMHRLLGLSPEIMLTSTDLEAVGRRVAAS